MTQYNEIKLPLEFKQNSVRTKLPTHFFGVEEIE